MLAVHANGGDDRAEDCPAATPVDPAEPGDAPGGRGGCAGGSPGRGGPGRRGHAGRLRGGGSGGTPTLTWYINPDSGGQAKIAAACSDASDGKYTIEISVLPRNSDAQREQLVRRLAAGDDSIDIMSLDAALRRPSSPRPASSRRCPTTSPPR